MERQCDAVRRLHRHFKGDRNAIIAALAIAFDRGEISRASNTHNWANATYARAVYDCYVRDGRI